MEGTLDGTGAWFHDPSAEASSHFGVGKDGRMYQWVDTDDAAWAEMAGNSSWISIECEGHSGDSLTDGDRNLAIDNVSNTGRKASSVGLD
jgi:hypothetical protein